MEFQSKVPRGDITTLLDLTPRDEQDAEFTPLDTEKTWWQPDPERRLHPFSMSIQSFPLRGPAAWGQRVTFDLGSVNCGDILLGTVLQLKLGHWFDGPTLARFADQTWATTGANLEEIWSYCNSIGSVIIARAELEIGDTTIEVLDGDFITVASTLLPTLNTQFGLAVDGLGRLPADVLKGGGTTVSRPPTRFQPTDGAAREYFTPRPFPTENGDLLIPLPFFFGRTRLQEGLPLLSIREGDARIHITFREFKDCVSQYRGFRSTCDAIPMNSSLPLVDISTENPIPYDIPPAVASATPPQFQRVQLLTYAANTHGSVRQALLRAPHEILYRELKILHFSEPLVYTVNTPQSDSISIQLPLEINHPVEEIVWFVRRKATSINNEWNNYSAILQRDVDTTFNPRHPLLLRAKLQVNGIDVVDAEEEWFRRHIAEAHKGGIVAYESYLYGYSFSQTPGAHQPNGTANMSRTSSARLCLQVRPPLSQHGETTEWEVKVFVLACQWLRFQDGIANRMYMS